MEEEKPKTCGQRIFGIVRWSPLILLSVFNGNMSNKMAAMWSFSTLFFVFILKFIGMRLEFVKVWPKRLDAMMVFTTLLAFIFVWSGLEFYKDYGHAMTNYLMAAFIFYTSVISKQPFALDFAAENVDPHLQNTPLYFSVCATISYLWLAEFLILATNSLVHEIYDCPDDKNWVFSILIPYGSLLITLVITMKYPTIAREQYMAKLENSNSSPRSSSNMSINQPLISQYDDIKQ